MHAILRYRWNIMLASLGALEVWLAATAVGPARILGVLGGLLGFAGARAAAAKQTAAEAARTAGRPA